MNKTESVIIEEKGTRKNEKTGVKENYTNKYMKGTFLGKGGFAKCYKVTNLDTKEIFAAKIVDKSSLNPKTKQKLSSEIKIHASLKHRNVVAFQSFFEDKQNVYILLEICNCNVSFEKS